MKLSDYAVAADTIGWFLGDRETTNKLVKKRLDDKGGMIYSFKHHDGYGVIIFSESYFKEQEKLKAYAIKSRDNRINVGMAGQSMSGPYCHCCGQYRHNRFGGMFGSLF